MSKVLLVFVGWWFGTFNGWDTLQNIQIQSTYDDLIGESFDVPVFSDELKGFEGQVVSIEGYTIPLQQSVEQD